MVGGHKANIGQVPVALGVVHAVADDKEVGNGEAHIIGLDLLDAARGLVEQSGDAESFGALLQEELAQVGKGEASVEDVFDDEYVLALDGLVEILDELDRAGGAHALSVTRCCDKVKGGVGLDRARQVSQKGRSAFEHRSEEHTSEL